MAQPEQRQKFFAKFAPLVRRGQLVVDLGAGDGWFAKKLAENGARVQAVERAAPSELPANVDWKTDTIEHWLGTLPADFRADAFLLRNVIQFLDKKWVLDVLLPQLAARLKSSGIIGIVAFRAQPEPPFSKAFTSYYTAEELAAVFPGWEALRNEDSSEDGKGIKGEPRLFHLAELIVRKP